MDVTRTPADQAAEVAARVEVEKMRRAGEEAERIRRANETDEERWNRLIEEAETPEDRLILTEERSLYIFRFPLCESRAERQAEELLAETRISRQLLREICAKLDGIEAAVDHEGAEKWHK